MVVKGNTTVKLPEEIANKIDKLVEKKGFGYKSRSNFVKQAINKEIEYCKMLQNLDSVGKMRFRDLWNAKKWKIYDETFIHHSKDTK